MKFLQTVIILAWVCAFLVFHPVISYADEPVPIKEGEPAPFDGVILTTENAAELLLTLEQQQTRCQAQIDFAVTTATNAKQLELDTCNSNLLIRTELFDTQLNGYRDYNQFLEERISKPKIPPEVVFYYRDCSGGWNHHRCRVCNKPSSAIE